MLAMIWGKFATTIIAIAGLVATLFGWRWSIRKGAKEELRNEIQQRTIEQMREANDVSDEVDSMDNDTIIDKLRENGWLK